jgi:hypothetical protein
MMLFEVIVKAGKWFEVLRELFLFPQSCQGKVRPPHLDATQRVIRMDEA